MIHPQAIIEDGARLGSDVQIGAFSVIGRDVVIGDGTWIGAHVVIHGSTRIGCNNKIYQFSSIGEAPQHTGYRDEPTKLEIGDDNTIREYCTLNRGTVEGGGTTRIGKNNFIMAYCHVAHDCVIGNGTVFANGASLAGHVSVGDFAILGGFTLVHQHCRVGAYCLTAIGTVLFKDVPPFVIAAGYSAKPHGINVRGLRRHGMPDKTVETIRKAYKTLYKSGHRLNEAVARLEQLAQDSREVALLATFVKDSERGVIR